MYTAYRAQQRQEAAEVRQGAAEAGAGKLLLWKILPSMDECLPHGCVDGAPSPHRSPAMPFNLRPCAVRTELLITGWEAQGLDKQVRVPRPSLPFLL